VRVFEKNVGKDEYLVVNDKELVKSLEEKKIKAKEDVVLQKRLKIEIETRLLKHFNLTEDEFKNKWRYIADNIATESLHVQVKELDTMVIQSIKLYDDLEKDINMHSMRIKEWYGLHFPELSNLIENNEKYLRAVDRIGDKENLSKMKDDECMEFDLKKVRELARNSVGSDLRDDDIKKIKEDIACVLNMITYRTELVTYITEKMNEIAPNVTELLGVMIGSRLLVKAGSLAALSKMPASTIQILGAEKALFNALRQNGKTPKFGILFHAPLVSNCVNKGRMARILAAKIAIAARVDYYKKDRDGSIGKKYYEQLDKKRQKMQEVGSKGVLVRKKPSGKSKVERNDVKRLKK
ncbi:Ribosome biogenesis protein - Nop58p/Nop5p, partial [Trachipleistophora hominis]